QDGGAAVVRMTRNDLDITDFESVTHAFASHSPDLVVNTAAYTAVDRAERDHDRAFAVNRDGPAHIARACVERQIPLLHLSTDYVFEGSGSTPLREDAEPNPRTTYGKSKLAGEQVVRELQEQHLILRTSWVFSATGSNFVRTVLRLARERDELHIVGDQTGCPTWAGHIADLIMELAVLLDRQGNLPWGTFHYCGAPATTWHGFAEEILKRARTLGTFKAGQVVAITSGDHPTPAPRPAYGVMSCDKIKRTFGVEEPSWRDALDGVLKDLLT
ncbi:MAG: dTDP-4-dehydrorhamnose reductase, partial [Gemmatimonadetes bacterium]|nr:dTDP-4-dehydrorhamnose reductase [Gemmatimonadota bacterium]